MANDEDTLKEATEAFTLCVDAWSDNRKDALDDFKFARLGEQWPDEAKKMRRGRPMHVINKMPAFIRSVVNDARMNKPSIRVRPADSKADVATARIYDGLIRNIEQISVASIAYDTASDHAATGGFGWFRVGIEFVHDDTFDKEILIQTIENPFSVYPDPHSTSATSADWNLAFIVDVIEKNAFQRKYKGAEPVDWSSDAYGRLTSPWRDGEQIMVAEQWLREEVKRKRLLMSTGEIIDAEIYKDPDVRAVFDAEGTTVEQERDTLSWKVTQRIMTGAEILEENEWTGRYIPIIPVYGEDVNVDGKRYLRSLIRDAKDAQRSFNYHRSVSSELVGLAPRAPFIGPDDAFQGEYADRWDTANTENHPFLAYKKGAMPPQRQPLDSGPAAASIGEALASNDDMKAIMGIYDASLGQRSNETSGRAILARQREGDTSTFHFTDNLSRAIHHAGTVIIDLIPQVYTGKRMQRILGIDGKPMTVGLNQPVFPLPEPGQTPHPLAGQPFQAPPPGQGAPAAPGMPRDPANPFAPPGAPPPPADVVPPGPPQPGAAPGPMSGPPPGPMPGMPMPHPALPQGQPLQDGAPTEDQITAAVYDLAAGRYDLVVEAGPSFNTKREEAAAQMTELLRAFPPAAPVIGDLLVKNLDWPGAEEIGQRLRSLVPAGAMGKAAIPPQAQAQIDQMGQVIQQGGAKMQELMQQLQQATAQLEAEKASQEIEAQKLEIERMKADTERMQAETAAATAQADLLRAQAEAQATPPDPNALAPAEQYRIDKEFEFKRLQMESDAATARFKAQADAEAKVEVARIQQQTTMQTTAGQNLHDMRIAAIAGRGLQPGKAVDQPAADGTATAPTGDATGGDQTQLMDPFAHLGNGMHSMGAQIAAGMNALAEAMRNQAQQHSDVMAHLAGAMTAPRAIVHDAKGRPIGVRTVAPQADPASMVQ